MGHRDRGGQMKAIEITGLSFTYKGSEKKAFTGIDLDVEEGSITAVVGKSGCGKSTLLRCIAGLCPRVYQGEMVGTISIFGEKISSISHVSLSTIVGIVFQNPATQLFSPTIEDELAFGPENLCIPREEIGNRMNDVLRIIGLEKHRNLNPANLSGGQQQLVAIGSVLTMKPRILLCDEILSWLDLEGRKAVRDLLIELKKHGTTILLADHRDEKIDIADKIVRL